MCLSALKICTFLNPNKHVVVGRQRERWKRNATYCTRPWAASSTGWRPYFVEAHLLACHCRPPTVGLRRFKLEFRRLSTVRGFKVQNPNPEKPTDA